MTKTKILTTQAANEMAANAEGLDYEAFMEWVEYRKATGKPVKPGMYPWLISRMVKMGDRQREAVEHSAGNGYQGLFLPTGRSDATARLTVEDLK
jgi:hypothetical protein